jgi:hypothetical protein
MIGAPKAAAQAIEDYGRRGWCGGAVGIDL